MDAKLLTRLGLLMMTPEAREERLSSIMQGSRIDCPALAALIDECRDSFYVMTDEETENVDEQQKVQIRWMLSRIKGEDVVRSINPNELAEWVVDLVETKGTLGNADFATIAKTMMKME